MLQSLKSSLLRTGYLTRQQLAEAEEYREAASCSLPRALWSLRVMHPGKFVNLCRQILDRPRLRDWLLKHSLDPELPWLIEPIDLVPVRFLPCGWLDPQTVVVATEEPGFPAIWQSVKHLCPEAEKLWEIPATEKQILTVILERKLAAELLGSRLTLEQWQQALEIRRRTGSSLGQVLTRLSYLSTPEYLSILAHLLGYPAVSELMGTGLLHRDESLSRQFDPEVMMRHLFYPLSWTDEHTLTVMVNDPLDWVVDELLYSWRPGLRIEKVLGTEQDITQLLSQDQGSRFSQEAVYKLMARLPEESASRVFTPSQIAVGYGLLLLFLLGLATAPWTTLTILVLLINLFYVASILFKLLLSLVGSADRFHQITDEEVAALDDRDLPIYTILVPVYKEPEVMPILIKSLSKLDYPHERLDVLILLEENDRDTIEAARAAKPPRYVRLLLVPDSKPKTKPKACNYGLAFARGEYLTIYDAEDIPDPDQLKKAVIAFRKGDPSLVCVQAALNYFNRSENFLTRMFTLEYSYWFDYLLPGLETLRMPIPLGGTSNHFRTDRLRELQGWDPFNVTEDADLGIRASQHGYTVGVINSTTYEEANCAVKNWIRQRSRWIKGYMQTWLVHNRNPLRSLRKLGLKNWLSYQFFIGGSFFTFLTSPIMWLLFIYWLLTRAHWLQNLFPSWLVYLGLFNLLVGNAIGIYLNLVAVFRRGYYDLAFYALLNPIYWQLHSMAAYMALWQLFTKPFYWEKTIHGLSKFTHAKVQEAAHKAA
ncbi:glycosyltransferase [Synechococcus sp. JA-2-3B'a(2-13)]|uniref:glycosyltransferase n=1 Tax=Synechococcus sp. (strain JA-2-3B'a(2-13)) TaxID=321332 RepID=UPI0000694BFC|nr:glycosyltransferase [Synechococcus sp. JA-2-3B'a(2-13)]ABD01671.1 glycosyl transferase, group 2 family protein [Synechococcus sp. JA-2-3B'a(2-13)]